MPAIVPMEKITSKIYLIREKRVMLDRDLAGLYGVKTKALKQAVRRNMKRFPEDFMFELTQEEFGSWRSQFVTSRGDKMGLRYPPMAFTEQGVAMLSSVLNSERAIEVNIAIMRAFMRLRQMLSTHEELKRKIEAMERKYDRQFRVVFEAIKQLIDTKDKPKKRIGFEVKEAAAAYSKRGKRKPH
ncbi:MAG: ORF6N domain-containing protein [Deltaproteobacteria bacterium]|nr:ORF6N domain-containing protein [Deltaproteobacteria bacterium]